MNQVNSHSYSRSPRDTGGNSRSPRGHEHFAGPAATPQDRPTPHFFWQDGPSNENSPYFSYAQRYERESSINSHELDRRAFEAPSWFRDAERRTTGRRGAILIAAALTVSCGVGLGLLLLQLQGAGARGPQASLPVVVGQSPAADQATTTQAKPAEARIAEATISQQIPPAPMTSPSKTNRQTADARAVAVAAASPTQTQAATTTLPLDPAMVALRQRAGEQMLSGDIIGARAFLLKAAQLGDAGSAYELARSYDPDVIGKLNILGPEANPQLALHWYRQASAGGHAAATRWIEHLQSLAARQAAN